MNSVSSSVKKRQDESTAVPSHDIFDPPSSLAFREKNLDGKDAEDIPYAARIVLPASLPSTWVLTQINVLTADGQRVGLRNSIPNGLLIIDARGQFILHMVVAHELSHCFTNSRVPAPDINPMVFETQAHFGKLRVSKTRMQMQINHSSVRALEGVDLNAGYMLDGDRLTFVTTLPLEDAIRAIRAESTWLRYSAKT